MVGLSSFFGFWGCVVGLVRFCEILSYGVQTLTKMTFWSICWVKQIFLWVLGLCSRFCEIWPYVVQTLVEKNDLLEQLLG